MSNKNTLSNQAGSYAVLQLPHRLPVRAQQTAANALLTAMQRNQLQLFYQPQMDLHTGNIVGAEALVRWRLADGTFVSPAQCIALAGKCGLLVPLGRWVLRQACIQAAAWQQAGFPAMRIAINVSREDLSASDFSSEVWSVLGQTGLSAACLELELPGDLLAQDWALIAATLTAFNKMGVKLALASVGTGHSSLRHLKQLPLDTVKIDRSLVRNLSIDRADASSVHAILGMGRSLNMQVVAEGVETRDQLQFLRQHGCAFGQGFYFGPAVPGEDFTQMLLRAKRRRTLLAMSQQHSVDVRQLKILRRQSSAEYRG